MKEPERKLHKIYELPLYPSFSFENYQMDGLIPSCRIEGWRSFSESFDGNLDRVSDDMIYRGHRRSDWQLESTLARQFNGGSIDSRVSQNLLVRFRLAMRGRGFDLRDKDDNEIWAFGQHFGLATPMLDWTSSPFVALFFAFLTGDLSHEIENSSRAVFRINRALLSEVLPGLFFEPTLGENARLVNQAGLFTVTPDGGENLVSSIINSVTEYMGANPDDPIDLSQYICKIHIPNNDRIGCLNSLRKMNIHHANLFPDPMGASEYCNDWLFRTVEEERRKKFEEQIASVREKDLQLRELVPPLVSPSTNDIDPIAKLILHFAPGGISTDDAVSLAKKLDQVYQSTLSIDWPRYESAIARVRLAFKRILMASQFTEGFREKVADALVNIYSKRYLDQKG